MKQAELNPDQLLADLAKEVPPMPADFHDRWMDAVRTEAEHGKKPAVTGISWWPKIFSVAAAFVFLIGGTLIYRSTRHTILPEYRTADTPANQPVPEAGAKENAMAPETVIKENAAAGNADAGETMEEAFEAEDSAMRADAVWMEQEKEAPAAGEAPAMATVKETAEEMTMGTAEKPVSMTEAAGGATAVPESAAETAAASDPETEAEAAAKPVTDAPAASAETGDFFADMGSFLLIVWPYLLIAAVPLAVTAMIKRFRKGR